MATGRSDDEQIQPDNKLRIGSRRGEFRIVDHDCVVTMHDADTNDNIHDCVVLHDANTNDNMTIDTYFHIVLALRALFSFFLCVSTSHLAHAPWLK